MDEWMNKENLMYMYKGVSLKLKKKEGNHAVFVFVSGLFFT